MPHAATITNQLMIRTLDLKIIKPTTNMRAVVGSPQAKNINDPRISEHIKINTKDIHAEERRMSELSHLGLQN